MSTESLASEEVIEEKLSFTDFVFNNRLYISLFLLGLIFIGSGLLLFKNQKDESKIEVVEEIVDKETGSQIFIEVAGAVENPGVFSLSISNRIEDALIKAGGLSVDADRVWVEKYLNRATKLIDGQKIYIPKINEHSDSVTATNPVGEERALLGSNDDPMGLVNVNTATLRDLESLPGIGPVYAQNIIDQRPYSDINELVSKGAIKNFVFEKIKNKITVF